MMGRLSRRQFVNEFGRASFASIVLASSARSKAAEVHKRPQRATLAQLKITADVRHNLSRARDVFRQAGKEKADWVLLPEGFLDGGWGGSDQIQVAAAFAELQMLCRRNGVIGLIGTGWKQGEKEHTQIRVVDSDGVLVGAYSKTCLTYNDAETFAPGTHPGVFTAGGIKFGTLICNDLWVTPGFTDGPNPHLSKKQARAGVQVIFHAIASGADQRYRNYHESNLLVRAAEAKCPIVAVNSFTAPEVNATSGVIGPNFAYEVELPRDREIIRTVTFEPAERES